MSVTEFPIQFKRQFVGDLDVDKTFKTLIQLNDYLSDPVRYAGQIVTCEENEGVIYKLNNARTAWIPFSNTTNLASLVTGSDIMVTQTVGGATSGSTIVAGTRFDDVFKQILSPYITSKLNSFNVSLNPSASIYEVGQTVSVLSGSFTYIADSNGTNPKDFVITGTGFSGTHQSSPISASGITYQATTPTTIIWSLNAKNAKDKYLKNKEQSAYYVKPAIMSLSDITFK